MGCWYTDQDILDAIGNAGPVPTYVVKNRIKRPGMVPPKTANVRYRLRGLVLRNLVECVPSKTSHELSWRLPPLLRS
jgi:hypothetical protein